MDLLNREYNKLYKNIFDKPYIYKGKLNNRWDFAIKSIQNFSGSILDYGCGDGSLIQYYIDGGFTKISCVEVSSLRRKNIQKIYGSKVDLFNEYDFNKSKNKYDVICCLDVLDHIINPFELLKNFRNSLNKNGCLILTIPNFLRLDRRIRLLFGDIPNLSNYKKSESNLLNDGGKLGYYSKTKLKAMLKHSGFNNVKFKCYGKSKINSLQIFSGTISVIAS
tara:strand:- start:219 stop:881 length:663 start_codon:yes stop_codon:yes gene_type:complete